MLHVRDGLTDVDKLVQVILHEMAHAWQQWMVRIGPGPCGGSG